MNKPIVWKLVPTLSSLLIGGLVGWCYWRLIGCSDGTCYIQSNAYRMTIYGALTGGLIYHSFKSQKIK